MTDTRKGPHGFAVRAFTVNQVMIYLLLQQLPVQPSLQQVCPHLSLQQSLQLVFAEAEVRANAVTPRTAARERYASVRFIMKSP